MKALIGILLLGLLFANLPSHANIKLPALIGNHMVLQQNSTIKVWGKATPGEKVEVTASWNAKMQQTITKSDSTWMLQMHTPTAGGPYTIQLKGENTIVLSDILLGEVWLCSGQSNMEKPIGIKPGQKPVFSYEEEIKNANYDQIRLFHVPRKMVAEIQTKVEGNWETCSSKSVDSLQFSAVAYFFGRRLYNELLIPIGLIDATWGGTRIEPWTPVEGFKMIPSLDSIYQSVLTGAKAEKHAPTLLYNGMIAPLINYSISGCIWYQGESNLMDVNNGLGYEDRMKALVYGWREQWKNPEMPFYYVQIAPYRYYKERSDRVKSADELPLLWEAQTNCLSIPNTGMIVTTDLVDDLSDIHPRNKQDVGLRLANLALNKTYGKNKIAAESPRYKSLKIKNNKVILSFNNTEKALMTKPGKDLTFFTIANEDRNFVNAQAIIKKNKVIVYSEEVQHPIAVRFAWDEEAQPNLFNSSGLPAIPFRTDNW
ncbi:MAG: sialate O-acetylesterase [Prolixibacteraceae bacterium]